MSSREVNRRSVLSGIAATTVAATGAMAAASPAQAAPATTATPERLTGYTVPLSARGVANLAPKPPWFYVGDALGVEFFTTPAAAAAALPTGLEPDLAQPGRGFAMWVEWQFAATPADWLDPTYSQYSEFLIFLDATYQGRPVAWCPFIYVDNDNSMARGWVQGFPKKMGQIRQTRAYNVESQAAPVVGPGGKFGGTLTAGGRRLAEVAVTLQERTTGLPALTKPLVNLRHFPRLTAGQQDNPAVHELAQSVLGTLKIDNSWIGTGDLRFFPSPREEIADLPIQRVGVGFRGSLSYTVNDLQILG